MLNNLVANALEAVEGMPDGAAWIVARSSRRGRRREYVAVITVSDNGPGFQREMLARVFDPYVTSKPKGPGLGSQS